jgi:hypothetical protein
MQTESDSNANTSKLRPLPPTPQKPTVATPASSSGTETVSPTPASHQTQIATSTPPTSIQPPPRPPRPPRPKSTNPPPQPPPTISVPDIQRISNKGKVFNEIHVITR